MRFGERRITARRIDFCIKISEELILHILTISVLCSCPSILVRGVYGAYAKQARITKDFRDGCVAITVPAATRQVGGTGTQLLA